MIEQLKSILSSPDADLEDVARDIKELRAVLDPLCNKPATSNEKVEQDSTPAPKLDPSIAEFWRLNGVRR